MTGGSRNRLTSISADLCSLNSSIINLKINMRIIRIIEILGLNMNNWNN